MQLFKNNAYSTLGASLTDVATTLTVAAGQGDRFPVVAAPDFALVTLQDAANNIEIVKVTARTAGADSMTIVRAQEGTTARAWAIGDVAELRLTAQALNPLALFEGDGTAAGIRSKIGAVGLTGNETVAGNKNFSGAMTIGGASLTLSAAGARITGDFSNATLANRVMFQTSTVNGNTNIHAIANGTGSVSSVQANNSSDPANGSQIYIAAGASVTQLASDKTGTGTYLPMTFYTGGAERMRIDASGNVLVTNNTGGLGYGTGAGGSVTQSTSKATTVTLNRPCGQITLSNSALGPGAEEFFTFNNSLIASADTPVFTVNFSGNYSVRVFSVGAGNCGVAVKNLSGGSLSEAVTLNFAIIKGATS